MQNTIEDLLNLNFTYVITAILIAIAAFKIIYELVIWFANKIGVEFKWLNDKRKNRELLTQAIEEIKEIKNQQDKISNFAEEITSRLEILEEKSVKNEKATVEMMFHIINDKCDLYINSYHGVPSDEIIALTESFKSYKAMGGNHGLSAKFEYCIDKLPIIPSEEIKHG